MCDKGPSEMVDEKCTDSTKGLKPSTEGTTGGLVRVEIVIDSGVKDEDERINLTYRKHIVDGVKR